MTDRTFEKANAESRAALAALADTLSSDDLAVDVGGGWTVGSAFAHLAFWDRWQEARWRRAAAAGLASPPALPDETSDLVNDALDVIIHRLPADRAVAAWRDAAASLDAVVAALPDASVQAVLDGGQERLVHRSMHRLEHLAQIERALAARRA